MSIADLPNVVIATDNNGGTYGFVIDEYSPIKVGVMWVKMQELINHINDLEQKLLSAEELLEAEDIKKADEALKRDKFVDIADLQEKINGKSGSELDPGININ